MALPAETLGEVADLLELLPHAVIEGPDDEGDVREYLKELKALDTALDARRKADKKPHLDAGRKVDADYKGPRDDLASAIAEVKGRMAAYAQAVREAQLKQQRAIEAQAAEAQQLKKAAGAEDMVTGGGFMTPKLRANEIPDAPDKAPDFATRTRRTLLVYNEEMVPDQYRVLDKAAIERDLRAGKHVPGAKLEIHEDIVAR